MARKKTQTNQQLRGPSVCAMFRIVTHFNKDKAKQQAVKKPVSVIVNKCINLSSSYICQLCQENKILRK